MSPVEARHKLGLSVGEMAQLMGVHRDTYGKWERDRDKGGQQPPAVATRMMKTLVWLADRGMLEEYKASI